MDHTIPNVKNANVIALQTYYDAFSWVRMTYFSLLPVSPVGVKPMCMLFYRQGHVNIRCNEIILYKIHQTKTQTSADEFMISET